jgi:NAD+ diphosphatase
MLVMRPGSIYERYSPSLRCPDDNPESSILFLADADKLLVKLDEDRIIFPGLADFAKDSLNNDELDYLGMIDGHHCFCAPYNASISIPDAMAFRSVRTMLGSLEENISLLASRALHIALWSKKNKYCGVCGSPTQKDALERARKCTSCGNMIYPRISPAIIIAIIKGDAILLAHNKNFKGGWYSTVAGFMEPGETIEDCAEREVYEEVGVRIKNIRYFASQPWPYPDSLMIGLTAEYESGEVKPDGVEIDAAGFFRASELPETPGKTSVAGKLIDWFVNSKH